MGLYNWLEIIKIDEAKGIIEAQKRIIQKEKKQYIHSRVIA